MFNQINRAMRIKAENKVKISEYNYHTDYTGSTSCHKCFREYVTGYTSAKDILNYFFNKSIQANKYHYIITVVLEIEDTNWAQVYRSNRRGEWHILKNL